MKGIIRKTIKPSSSFIRGGGEEALGRVVWEVEYQEFLPHAGISKKGTGPGVGKKVYITKNIPLHPQDINNVDGSLFAEDGKEVEFEIDHMTPLAMSLGQEQYSVITQQSYGVGARIIHVTWDDVRDFMLEDEKNNSFQWAIEEFKKRNYEIPEKAITEIRFKKLKNES